jgi:hypothetical protein
MKRGLMLAAVTAAFALGTNAAWAGDEKEGDEKKEQPKVEVKSKVDLEALFKKLDINGDGKISLEEFKKLEEFYKPVGETPKKKGAKGGFDPEKIKKLIEKFGGGDGNFDPETIKKLLEKFKDNKGGFDLEKLKKLKDKIGDKAGVNFDVDQLLPFIEQILPNIPGVAADPKQKVAPK